MTSIDGMVLHAAKLIEVELESEVTDHPVEEGADVTDHVRLMPVRLTIDGLVSSEHIVEGGITPVEIEARMREIRAGREPVVIETPRRKYDAMILTSLRETQNSDTGTSYAFNASFKELIIATNQRATIRVAVPRAEGKKNRGNKALEEISTDLLAVSSFTASSAIVPPPSGNAKEIAAQLGSPSANGRVPINAGSGNAKTARVPVRSGGSSLPTRTLVGAGGG